MKQVFWSKSRRTATALAKQNVRGKRVTERTGAQAEARGRGGRAELPGSTATVHSKSLKCS